MIAGCACRRAAIGSRRVEEVAHDARNPCRVPRVADSAPGRGRANPLDRAFSAVGADTQRAEPKSRATSPRRASGWIQRRLRPRHVDGAARETFDLAIAGRERRSPASAVANRFIACHE